MGRMQIDAFAPIFCRNYLSKPHAKSLQHTQPSAQHCLGHPLGCANNKAEQGSWFFSLYHNTSSSVECRHHFQVQKGWYLAPVSIGRCAANNIRQFKHCKLTPKQVSATANTTTLLWRRNCNVCLSCCLEALFVGQQKHNNKAVWYGWILFFFFE